MLGSKVPLMPKNSNGPLKVIILGRISTVFQDKENIPASYRFVEQFLRQIYDGATEIRHLGEQASGMIADRATIMEAEELVATGEWDLVIVEDLSRIYRNPRYQWVFVQDCVDRKTRVICIADNLDTADENWLTMMHVAAIRHGMAIPDTRRRVRRTATHSFHNGGMVQKIPYGYRKLSKEEAASGQYGPVGLRIARLSECTPVIREIARRIMNGTFYDDIADWLNEEGIEPGPYVKLRRWTGRVVEFLVRCPLLSGTRTYRNELYEPVFRTGKHRREPNPTGPEKEFYAELAHITKEEHDQLLAVLKLRKGDRDFPTGNDHPLKNRPRSRSLWPCQHPTCAVCGARFYSWGKYLRCQNIAPKGPRTCWNHVFVDVAMIRAKVLPRVVSILNQVPGLRDALIQFAELEFERARRRHLTSGDFHAKRIAELESQAAILAKAIRRGGNLDALVAESAAVDAELKEARLEAARLLQQARETNEYVSSSDIGDHLEDVLLRMAETSFDFADLMRRLIPEFVIQPVQALDCGQVRPRGKLVLRTDAWSSGRESECGQEFSIDIDLFEYPLHVRRLPEYVQLLAANPKMSVQAIASAFGVNKSTVELMAKYHRLMLEAGTTDPYRQLHEKPQHSSRWRRRKRTGDE